MSTDALIAGAVFLVAYVAIATERFDRTLVALRGRPRGRRSWA